VVDKKLLALRCSYLQSGKKNPAREREREELYLAACIQKRHMLSAEVI
jgi:hypothetical protein